MPEGRDGGETRKGRQAAEVPETRAEPRAGWRVPRTAARCRPWETQHEKTVVLRANRRERTGDTR